ncbi:MAG: class I SAM-dependent methyltransferase [Pseudomonadota bacterium]
MGKRSDFKRVDRDFYPTPTPALAPLVSHLPRGAVYDEPCAGAGDLVHNLGRLRPDLRLGRASDVEPRLAGIQQMDFRDYEPSPDADLIITNPPWDRKLLHPMIEQFAGFLPTWLLFDADWVHTKQAGPFLPMLCNIVSVGRVKWIPGSTMTGKDNCAWHCFWARYSGPTVFRGRAA